MSSIIMTVENHIARVTLNRPAKLNAFTVGDLGELADLYDDLSARDDVRVVVLTGTGRAFCAGGDVTELRDSGHHPAQRTDEEAWTAVRDVAQRSVEAILGCRAITVAAVNGACAGGGLALACASDLRLASSGAVFTTAFAKVGQTGDMALAWLLSDLLGGAQARDLMLQSTLLDAAEAKRRGLVSLVVEPEQFGDATETLVTQLAAYAPLAVQGMKRNLDDARRLPLPEYLDVETQRYLDNSKTHDSVEAAAAFLAKRPPVYSGR